MKRGEVFSWYHLFTGNKNGAKELYVVLKQSRNHTK